MDETVTADAAESVEATPDQSEEAQTNPSTTAESNEEPAPAQSGTFTFFLRQPDVVDGACILQQLVNTFLVTQSYPQDQGPLCLLYRACVCK